MAMKRSACRLIRRVVPLLLVLVLLVGFLPTFARAAETGGTQSDTAALVLTGTGYFTLESSSSQLFHLEQAVPGTSWKGKVLLVNDTTGTMRTAVVSIESTLDDLLLYNTLELKIEHNGKTLYSGSYNTNGQIPLTEYIPVARGETETLDITVTLPITADNKIQGKQMDSTWTFEATTDAAPPIAPRRVTYKYEGDIPVNAPELPTSRLYAYKSTVKVAEAPAVEGYTFSWRSDDVDISTGSFKMPKTDVLIVGTWKKQAEPSTPVDPTPETYTVSYKYEGSVPENAPELPAAAKYTPGYSVTIMEAPNVEGYTFSWRSDDVNTQSGSFEMPKKDVLIIGTWEKKAAPEKPDEPTKPSEPTDHPQTGIELIVENVRDGIVIWVLLLVVLGTAIIALRINAAKKRIREQEGRQKNEEVK